MTYCPTDYRRDVNVKVATVARALLSAAIIEDSSQLDRLVAVGRRIAGERPVTKQGIKKAMLDELLKRLDPRHSPWTREGGPQDSVP